MTKIFPPIIATFKTEGEALAFVRGVEEALDYFPSESWVSRTTNVFGLLNGEWRAEIGLHD